MMLACARASAGDPGTVMVGCLARLDPSLLLTAFSLGAGAITLCTGACETCPAKEASIHLSSVVSDTRRVLESFDLPGQIDIEERQGRAQADDADRNREPATQEARSRPGGLRSTVITRRGFFGILRHGGTYAAATAAGVLAGHEEAVVDEGPRRELLVRASGKRERLLDALRLLVAETVPSPAADVLFAAPQLDGQLCDLCGLCGRLCPTGALTLAEGEGGEPPYITCRPEACVACRLCEEVCGRRALTLAPVPAARLLARAPEPVVLMRRMRNDVEPAQVAFEDKIRAGFEDKLQTLLGTPVYRS
jgi:ferredoxin